MTARRKVVGVIGNAAASPAVEAMAEELGRRLVDAGFRVATGGLGGVMQAASKGAHASERYREGDVVGLLPGADASAANRWVDVVVPTNLGYARNVLLVSMADAVVAVGGGAGTLSEIAMAWQLEKPLVALRAPGWSERLAGGTIDERARPPIGDAETPERAVELVQAALWTEA